MNSPSKTEVPATSRVAVIVNADDLGRSEAVNEGIFHAYQHGIVRSASLMVRWPAARDAVTFNRACPELGLGLHLDLGEWTFRDGRWTALYEVVPLNDARAVSHEIRAQFESFKNLVGRVPSHIDSHQHVHRNFPARSIVMELAHRWQIPVRHFGSTVRYWPDFYGQSNDGESLPDAVSTAALIKLLSRFRPGIHELGCHPAFDLDFDTMYREERKLELNALCDERVHAEVARLNITLLSFADWRESQQLPSGESRKEQTA